MKAKELIKVLEKHNPEMEVHIWDFGAGDHVPVGEVCNYNDLVLVLEPQEIELDADGTGSK